VAAIKDDRVLDPGLHVLDGVAGVALVPLAIEVLGHDPELDDEVAREVLRPDLAAFFLPEADQGLFVLAHDDAGVGAADEVAAPVDYSCGYVRSHDLLR
jgi:hypothetical protein